VSHTLAAELRLPLPDLPWHTERDRVAEAATLFGLVAGTLGKMARDISLMTQTEIAEVSEPEAPGRGGSSTMPQKRNPIGCAVVLAAAMRVPGLVSTMLSAMVREHERALGVWQAEWETLPEIVCLTGGALHHMLSVIEGLEIDAGRMLGNLETTRGLVFAESASMLLAARLGGATAHELLEKASAKTIKDNRYLREVLQEDATIRAHLANDDIAKLFSPLSYIGVANEFITRAINAAQE
jgi:3-carboxy-cis,cis-muconate cycloisomerase